MRHACLVLFGTFTPTIVDLVVRIARNLSSKETVPVEDCEIGTGITCKKIQSAFLSPTNMEEARLCLTYRQRIRRP